MNIQNSQQLLDEIRISIAPGLNRVHEIMQQVAEKAPGCLAKYLGELVGRKGKRLRATFVLLIASTSEKDCAERAAYVASSIELLHLATLVHDDIIDGSDMRRNVESAHRKWGTRIAVLVGDLALSKAMELIIEEPNRRIPSSISKAASFLVEGEVLEIEFSGDIHLTEEKYYEVIYGKTASLWETCGECGALVADLDPKLIVASAQLGRNMGIAFQIIDDLLDYGVGAKNLGKKTNNDLENGLITLPLIRFFKSCSSKERERMTQLLHKPKDADSREEVRALLQSSGCFDEARNIANKKIEYCLSLASQFPVSPFSSHLKNLCEIMALRSA